MTPTRELATQVAESFKSYSSESSNFKTVAIYGGTDYRNQISALKRKVDVVVGTPGRIMDHIRQGTFKIKDINCLVLDEADEMLNMGFKDDLDTILSETPEEKQTLLFSATMPKEVMRISKNYMFNPKTIEVASRNEGPKNVEHHYDLGEDLYDLFF